MQKPKFKDAIKNMTFKEKKEYIWEYYKLHIISTFAIIFMVGLTVYEVNRNRVTHVSLVVTGGMTTVENVNNLSDHLNESLLTEDQKQDYRILVQSIPFSVGNENQSFENTQKLFVLMAAGEIDLIILDEPNLDHFMEQEFLLDLNELNIDFDGVEVVEREGQVVGINIDENELFSDLLFDEGWILSVIVSSERLEETEKSIHYLMGHQD